MWQVVACAILGALGAYVMGLLLGHDQVRALSLAAGFGGATLLLQAIGLWRSKAAGRPEEAPPSVSPYDGDWPPAH